MYIYFSDLYRDFTTNYDNFDDGDQPTITNSDLRTEIYGLIYILNRQSLIWRPGENTTEFKLFRRLYDEGQITLHKDAADMYVYPSFVTSYEDVVGRCNNIALLGWWKYGRYSKTALKYVYQNLLSWREFAHIREKVGLGKDVFFKSIVCKCLFTNKIFIEGFH